MLLILPGEDAQRAHELIPNNKLVDMKSGHDVHYEKPREFINVMLEFLDTLPAE